MITEYLKLRFTSGESLLYEIFTFASNYNFMSIAKSLMPEFEYEMANTRKLLEVIPMDKADWKPHEKSFSLGRLTTHVAEIPGWLTMTLNTEGLDFSKGDYKPFATTSSEELLAFFDKNVAEAKASLEKATDEDFMQNWTMRNGDQVYFTMSKIAVVRTWALNHLYHHRAQLTVYLRLLDVKFPGMYGPTADDTM